MCDGCDCVPVPVCVYECEHTLMCVCVCTGAMGVSVPQAAPQGSPGTTPRPVCTPPRRHMGDPWALLLFCLKVAPQVSRGLFGEYLLPS